jgi:hypothetical protein
MSVCLSAALFYASAAFFSFLSFFYTVGFPGWGISPCQGRYLLVGQHRHRVSFFFNFYSGGGVNWVHSALRPPEGLLCQPRVIMMENLVE